MNIRRVAFRILVVLSILWAGFIVAILLNDPGIPSLRRSCSELRAFVVDQTQHRLGDDAVRACEAQWSERRSWILVTTAAPPIGLLLAGPTVGWIASGFRRAG